MKKKRVEHKRLARAFSEEKQAKNVSTLKKICVWKHDFRMIYTRYDNYILILQICLQKESSEPCAGMLRND